MHYQPMTMVLWGLVACLGYVATYIMYQGYKRSQRIYAMLFTIAILFMALGSTSLTISRSPLIGDNIGFWLWINRIALSVAVTQLLLAADAYRASTNGNRSFVLWLVRPIERLWEVEGET